MTLADTHIPEEIVARYCDLIQWALRIYRWHPEWEDLEAEARLEVWRMLGKLDSAKRLQADALVVFKAKQAAMAWLRSPRNSMRATSQRGNPLIETTSIHDPDEVGSHAFATEDFAVRVVHLLWCREIWRMAEVALLPSEWSVVRYQAIHGKGAIETMARRTGEHPKALQSRGKRGMQKLRRLVQEFEREC